MSSASRNGLPWSEDDVKRLRALAAAGRTSSQVAEALNRTKVGIKSKALSLGIALAPDRRTRQVVRGVSRTGAAENGSKSA